MPVCNDQGTESVPFTNGPSGSHLLDGERRPTESWPR